MVLVVGGLNLRKFMMDMLKLVLAFEVFEPGPLGVALVLSPQKRRDVSRP